VGGKFYGDIVFVCVCELQFRENVAAWVCFHDRKDVFKEFLERVIRLKEVFISLSLCIIISYIVRHLRLKTCWCLTRTALKLVITYN